MQEDFCKKNDSFGQNAYSFPDRNGFFLSSDWRNSYTIIMALRLIEIFLPLEEQGRLLEKLESFSTITIVQKESSQGIFHAKLIILIILSKR